MNTKKYKSLLSPLKIGGYVLKNRMESSNSTLHSLQGPEPYPADGLFTHYVNRAKNGAAIVTISGINSQAGLPANLPANNDIAHFPDFDLYNAKCQNYLIQLTEAIHFYGSLASVGLFAAGNAFPLQKEDGSVAYISGVSVPNGQAPWQSDTEVKNAQETMSDLSMGGHVTDDLSVESMELIAESFAQQAEILKGLGFDMITIHMAYRAQLLGQFFSPLTNDRTDEYGGSLKGRAKYPLMVLKKIRERVGKNFLIEVQLSGEEDGGYSKEDAVAFLKMAKGLIDIVQVRCGDVDNSSPTGMAKSKIPSLPLAEYIKKSGVPVKVAAVGGFLDPEEADQTIAGGKADIISMARAWISNPNYGQLLTEGRGEDVVPCLRCNKCHGRGEHDTYASICSVNPVIGLENRIDHTIVPPVKHKRVAIIGGGPAGMRCAIELYDRGHVPVIYEISDALGGAARHADYADFKWPLKDFKDYLIRQVCKRGIEVRLNCYVTPKEIANEFYDVVVAALGASPVMPLIPGLKEAEPVFYQEAFQTPEKLGKRVVIIGGGEVGVEIGIYLARSGHIANVVEMRERLAADATKIHYYSVLEETWKAEPDFHGYPGVKVERITEKEVLCISSEGKVVSIPYDSIVVSAGMAPLKDEALEFQDCARQFFMIGDCGRPATIHEAIRTAYGTACQI